MLALLDSPLGGAFYALFMLLLTSAATVWLYSRAGSAGVNRRVTRGLGVLMALRLLQLPVYVLAWLGQPLAAQAAAPLERGVLLLSLVVIVGLWSAAHSTSSRSRLINALPAIGAIIFALCMLLYWLGVPSGSSFNYTDADYAWSAASGLVALLGILQIGTRTPTEESPSKARGLIYIGLLLLGHVVHILLAEPFGNLPLLAQAAALLAAPLLFALPAKVTSPAVPAEDTLALQDLLEDTGPVQLEQDLDSVDEDTVLAEDVDSENEPASDDEADFFALGPELPSIEEMQAQEDSLWPVAETAAASPAFFDEVETAQAELAQIQQPSMLSGPEELARELAEILGAEVCVLATHNDAQLQLEFQYGYNVLRGAPVEPARVSLREVPRLASALQRGRILRMEADAAPGELAALSQALRLSFPGHLMLAPFTYPQDVRPWAVLALHLEQPWQASDEIKLEQAAGALGEELAELLGVTGRPTGATQLTAPLQSELEHTRAELESLQAENARYRADVERLLAHIDSLQGATQANQPEGEQAGVLTEMQQENEQLKQSLAVLQTAPSAAFSAAGATPAEISAEQAKEELRLALEEVAAVHARLEAAQQAIVESTQRQPEAKIPAEQVELVTSIAQELRQPLSSVMGYTDLLLGESVGLLGALQRKFLERVRSSTERMNTLVDNLIRIAELDTDGQNVQRSLVDLAGVIDDALSLLREPMQEKRIALRVNLPRQLPALNTDRDALQQILYHLLQNADAATPAGGAISLAAAHEEQEDLGEYVLIQVSDSGGGIPEDALPRVFSRVYRAQNPVISGVGDSGVGLTIAETLTKALGGRIWVESQAGVGSTFSVLLPLSPAN